MNSLPTDQQSPALRATTARAQVAGPELRNGLIVVNPIAGRGRAEAAARELAAGLERAGMGTQLFLTRARGDAQARVRALEPQIDFVVAVGGDGTVGEVFEGLGTRAAPVAIHPMGTANVMSLDLGLPRDVAGTLAMIRRGRTRRLDTARVNGRELSFLVTGVGIDGSAVRELDRRRNGPITKWTYVGASWRALLDYRPPRLRVNIDGEELPGHFGLVLVSNIVNYGGFKVLAPDRRLDDGLFEVYLFPHGSRTRLFAYAARALLSGLPGGSCTLRRGRRIEIVSELPVPYHVDGDYRGETPVVVEVTGPQVTVLIP